MNLLACAVGTANKIKFQVTCLQHQQLKPQMQKSLQSSVKNVFLKPNINKAPFNQRSLVHREAFFSGMGQTDIHTQKKDE